MKRGVEREKAKVLSESNKLVNADEGSRLLREKIAQSATSPVCVSSSFSSTDSEKKGTTASQSEAEAVAAYSSSAEAAICIPATVATGLVSAPRDWDRLSKTKKQK